MLSHLTGLEASVTNIQSDVAYVRNIVSERPAFGLDLNAFPKFWAARADQGA